MAACPWCKVQTTGVLWTRDYAYCTSSLNPGNSKRGDYTGNGCSYSRCAMGNTVDGIDFKHCPFFKKKATRKKR